MSEARPWTVHIARISGSARADDLEDVCARAYSAGASQVVVDIEDARRIAEFRTENGRFVGFAAEVQS